MKHESTFPTTAIRRDFSFLATEPPSIYFDNASTTQMPETVVAAMDDFYRFHNGNVSRGNHRLTREATTAYDDSRKVVSNFIYAESPDEIVFTSGTTDSINLLASALKSQVTSTDTILLSQAEHHSNLLPWIKLSQETGATITYLPIQFDGTLDINVFLSILEQSQPKIIALPLISNVLGTLYPLRKLFELAKKHHPDIITVVDAAQAIGHIRVNVDQLNCDFLAFSGHKIYGPMGIGVLFGRKNILNTLTPKNVGGGMVTEVESTTFTTRRAPAVFEAGTPNVAGAIGLAAAIKYIKHFGMEEVQTYEKQLRDYLVSRLQRAQIDGLNIFGQSDECGPIVSFVIDGVAAEDMGNYLDTDNIMVRSGHHCTIPLHRDVLKTHSTLRVSFAVYNTTDEIDALIESIKKACSMLR